MSIKKVMLGIDIGGTNTKFGLVQKNGKVVAEFSVPTKSKNPAKELVARIEKSIKAFLKDKVEKYQLCGIGIGAPNANYHSGQIENPPNLKWGTVDISSMFKESFNVQVKITNDANASALGEMLFGAAKGMSNFVTITLGTGLGSGIVVGGKMLYGSNGFAGELGHVCIEFQGRECGCGNRGCLECYVSATGIVRTVAKLIAEKKTASKMRELPFAKLSAKLINELALEGDEIALEAFDFTARLLGVSCANVAMLNAPEAFIICGGLANAGDLLIKKTKEYMELHLLKNFKNQIKILPSGLINKNSGVIGASALAWSEFEN